MSTTDDCNHDLRDLFEREHRQLPPEPFLEATAVRLEKRRVLVAVVKRSLQVAALAAVVLASPWLISGSGVLSAWLAQLFAAASGWLSTRTGTAAVLFCVVALLVWRRRSIL